MDVGSATATLRADQTIVADGAVTPTPAAELPFFVVLCLLAASIPNESLFGGYDPTTGRGLRSPSYYLGVLAAILAILFIPRMTRAFLRSTPMVLITLAFSVGLVVLTGFVLTGEAHYRREYQIDRQYKSIFMAVMMLVAASHPRWRRRLADAYYVGAYLFIAIALWLVLTGRASTSQHLSASRTSVLGMNENVQSTFAASGVILTLTRALLEERTRRLLLWGALYVAGVAAFLLGTSRTGLVGLLAAHALVLASTLFGRSSRGRSPLARLRIPLVVVFLVLGTVLATRQVSVVEKAAMSMEMRSQAAIEGGDVGHRDILAAATLRLFQNNPAGVGMGRTWDALQGSDPHNGYLKLAAEGGVAALLLFALAQLSVVRHARRWVAADPQEIGIAGCLVLFSLSAVAGQGLIESPYWVFFGLLAADPRDHQIAGRLHDAAKASGGDCGNGASP